MAAPIPEVDAQISVKPLVQADRPVCCKACGHVVTRKKDRCTGTEGEHTFRNPAGYSFHLITFEQAAGCEPFGSAVREASWFPGYAWRLALCAKCEVHLGWRFENSESSFFGLIVTRLTGL